MTEHLEEPVDPEEPEAGEEQDPISSLLQAHHTQIISQQQVLDEHEKSVDWLLQQFTPEGERKYRPVSYCWRYLAGEDRAKMWGTLREFVDWLNHRYFSRSYTRYVPPCWYRHGGAVEELTAVWAGWHSAYYNHQDPGDEAAYWHDRILWPALGRLELEFKECREAKQHKEKKVLDWSTDEQFDDFIQREPT